MKRPFKVGDLATTSYFDNESNVVRKITKIIKGDFGSGWGVQADGGVACSKCGRISKPIIGSSTGYVDAAWFKKVT